MPSIKKNKRKKEEKAVLCSIRCGQSKEEGKEVKIKRIVKLIPIGQKEDIKSKDRKQKKAVIKVVKTAEKKRMSQKTEIKKRKKKSNWKILTGETAQKFVLRKNTSAKKESFIKKDDIEIIGLPEAGKEEPWNLLQINEKIGADNLLKTEDICCQNQANILEEYDDAEENFLNGGLKRAAAEDKLIESSKSYVSPHIVNLKEYCEEEEDEEVFIEEENKQCLQGGGVEEIFSESKKESEDDYCPEPIKITKCIGLRYFLKKLKIKTEFIFRRLKQEKIYKKPCLAPAFNFAFIALLVVLPLYGLMHYTKVKGIKGRVLGDAIQAVENLKLGKELLELDNLEGAKFEFSMANENFQSASESLEAVNQASYNLAIKLLNKEQEVESARALIEAGKKASEISSVILEGFGEISFSLKTNLFSDNVYGDDLENSDYDSAELLVRFNNTLKLILPKARELSDYVEQVEVESVPEQYKNEIYELKNLASLAGNKIENYIDSTAVLMKFLAKGSFKRYLLVFQNNNEIRPTGGFIGSYALMDIKDGKIVNLEVPEEGSYHLQGTLLENIKPPHALRLINSRWEFQDSNWWPDFPSSAKFISSIYEKSGGPTVDGVIAVNASLIPDILDISGSVEMAEYGKVITSGNFMEETQKAVELEYDQEENKPKKFISDFMPKFLKGMFDLDQEGFFEILKVFNSAFVKRNIQIYSSDEALEEEIVQLGWGGEIKDMEGRDYLALVDTNLGGKKTDSVIFQEINHKTNILEDGTIINELIINKKHNGLEGDYFEGANNVDYLRVYVPEGSIFVEGAGFNPPPQEAFKQFSKNIIVNSLHLKGEENEKVDIESGTRIGRAFGKTYFANWTNIMPGEEITIRLKYQLPFNAMDGKKIGKYSLYLQKQPGCLEHSIVKDIFYPDNLNLEWAYPGRPENGRWIRFDTLNKDKFYGIIFSER